MRNTQTEKLGIHKIVSYPKEVYCLHYKGKPFSLSYIDKDEQRKLGIQYPSSGSISRKAYFSFGSALVGIQHLPEPLRDKVEIVKYSPVNEEKQEETYPLFKNDV